MRERDLPLIGALGIGAVLLVVGVGSVFVSPSGQKTVEGGVPVDLPIARPLPAPVGPAPGAVRDAETALKALLEEDAALRDTMLEILDRGGDQREIDAQLQELYLVRWNLGGERAQLMRDMADIGLGPTMEARAELAVDPRDDEVVSRFLDFIADPTGFPPTEVFADEVALGLGWDLLKRVEAGALTNPGTWVIGTDETFFSGGTGPYDLFGRARDHLESETFTLRVGPHPHCASGPKPAPIELDHLRRVSIVLVDDSIGCLSWSSLELHVDDDGDVHGVTWDVWEP